MLSVLLAEFLELAVVAATSRRLPCLCSFLEPAPAARTRLATLKAPNIQLLEARRLGDEEPGQRSLVPSCVCLLYTSDAADE